MIEYAYPEYLYGLIAVLVLAVLSVASFYLRRRALHQFTPSRDLRDLIMPLRIGRKRLLRDALLLLAGSALIFALARPRVPSKTSTDEQLKGIELMLCLDVSNSMLSPDFAPSRMSFVKRAVSRLISERMNDRIGIIIFAADAYVQLPITSDLNAAQEFLLDVSPQMLSAQGTNIAGAIELARGAFSDRKDVGKAIIVFTDAEDHAEGAKEAAEQVAGLGIKVSVVGVGTQEGGIIPMPQGALKDEEGQLVTTRLNPELAQSIAVAGGGSYISSANETEVLRELQLALDQLPKAVLGARDTSGYTEYYDVWVWIAVGLLLVEVFISQRRNRLWAKYNIFHRPKL